MTSDLPAGDVIVLHDGNGRHAYHALTLAMVALDALATDQSSRALGCAQGARYGCPKAAASSLEQIVCTKAGSFTHPKDLIITFALILILILTHLPAESSRRLFS